MHNATITNFYSEKTKQVFFFFLHILLLKSFRLHSDRRIKFEFVEHSRPSKITLLYLSSFISTSCFHESASTSNQPGDWNSLCFLTSLHTSTILPTFQCLFHYICHKHWLTFPKKAQKKILNHTFSFPKWIKLTHLALE